MREKITRKTVYQFDELSDRAKDNARDWYRQASSDDFVSFDAETVLEDAARIAELFGLNIRQRPVKLMNGSTRMEPDVYYSVGDRSSGADYTGYYGYRKGSARAVAAECPSQWTNADGTTGESKSNAELNRIAADLSDIQRRNFYAIGAVVRRRGYSRDFALDVDVERTDSKPFSAPDDEDAVATLLRDFAEWIHGKLEREYEYCHSDECVDENIEANEYEFDEDGNRA